MLPGRRFLVVDDVRDAAETLAYVLNTMGYEAQLARSRPRKN
jgi:hypoxanthine phosphoribosyltransferase